MCAGANYFACPNDNEQSWRKQEPSRRRCRARRPPSGPTPRRPINLSGLIGSRKPWERDKPVGIIANLFFFYHILIFMYFYFFIRYEAIGNVKWTNKLACFLWCQRSMFDSDNSGDLAHDNFATPMVELRIYRSTSLTPSRPCVV